MGNHLKERGSDRPEWFYRLTGHRPVKIKTEEITAVIKQEIEQFASELEVSEVGRVVEVGDGFARVYGLSS